MTLSKITCIGATLRLLWAVLFALFGPAAMGRAAVIGVLDDGRQAGQNGYLSLLGDSSAEARLALQADGHTLVSLDSVPPSSPVDVLWLPLLASSSAYDSGEAIALKQYVIDGGSIVFIGGPDVYNNPDNSFLNQFGLVKIEGNLNAASTPSVPNHPVVTGPHGAVQSVGSIGGYGLFASVADVADVFEGVNTDDPPATGTLAGFVSPGAEISGAGRLALICDPFMFGPSLDQPDRDHRAFLRNVVEWAAALPGYTPSGTSVATGMMSVACGGCDTVSSVEMTFASVSATGVTTVTSLGTGRCGFDGAIPDPLPLGLHDFVGYGLALDTTAVHSGLTDVVITVDPASLSALGIQDPTTLEVWWVHPISTDLISVPAVVDQAANTASFQMSELGAFLVGADVDSFADCDQNGMPDECQPAVLLTFVADSAEGGSVTPDGSTAYPVCQTVSISAVPNPGFCFDGWTVDTGSGPVDASGEQTTVDVDVAKTVTAHFVPVITDHPADQLACAGGTATFSITIDTNQANATFEWQRNETPLANGGRFSGVDEQTLTIDAVELDDAGSYRCVVTNACDGGEPVASEPGVLTVGQSPSITVQPVSGTVCVDGTLSLSVEAEGTAPLSYQWWKDETPIDGAGESSYTINDATSADGGAYQVVVSNACGTEATSQTATVDVQDRPTIDVHPAGGTRCEGASFEFDVETTGGEPLLYQWRRNGAAIEGATERVLMIDPVTAADPGEYVVIVQNSNGCGAVTSEPAELIVESAPAIVEGPVDQDVCEGGVLSLAVTATGTEPLYYQWHKDGLPIDGETYATLTIPSVEPNAAGAYTVVVTNDTDCGTATSEAATVTILSPTVVTGDPADRVVCAGGAATFTIEATGAGLQYQWSFRGSGAQQFIDLADGGAVSGANAAALVLSPANAGHAGEYHCTVFGDCSDPYVSPIVHLDVTPGACDCNGNGTPDADDIANEFSQDCDGDGVPDECELAAGDCNADGVPDGCQLANNDCNGDGVPDDCQLNDSDCNADGILDECQLLDNDCNGNGVPDDCEPAFTVDVGTDLTGCTGQPLALNAVVDAGASNPPLAYQWQIVSGPGGTIIGETLETPHFQAATAGTYQIELTVSDSSEPPCVVSDVVTVTVDDLAITVGPAFRMCFSGTSEPLAVDVLGGSGQFAYTWTVEPGSPSTSQEQFTGSGAASESPTFTPDAAGVYGVRVTVENLGGSACMASKTIAITAAALEATGPSDFGMCVNRESGPLPLTVSAADPGALAYEWSIEDGSPNVDAGQFTGAGPFGANPSFTPTSTGTYVLRTTVRDDNTPPCETSVTVSVTVGAMTVDAGPDVTACVGEATRLAPSVEGAFGSPDYSWSIEAGSPSTDPGQFSDPHAFAATPMFIPASRGIYALRLTVRDDGLPACEASDVVIVRATELNVDAGEDFVTQAFQPSRALGVVPLAAGADAPYAYHWSVMGGPLLNPSQFSDTAAEHPRFAPAATGTYLIGVSVADAAGVCVASDSVVLEAITASEIRDVNVEGRMFMTLRLGGPQTRAEVRVSEATAGVAFEGHLTEGGNSANPQGMAELTGSTRHLSVTAEPTLGPFVVVIAMFYGDDEVSPSAEGELRLHRQESDGHWQVAGLAFAGFGPYPVRAGRLNVGSYGIDPEGNCVWAVMNHVGTFAIGFPEPVGPNSPDENGGSSAGPQAPPDLIGGPMCGAAGASGTALILAGMLAGMAVFGLGKSRGRAGGRAGDQSLNE